MKLSQLIVGLLLILLIVMLYASVFGSTQDPAEILAPGQAAPAMPDPSEYSETWGPEGAPVMLQAYLPRGNAMAERVVTAFRKVQERRPADVRSEVVDMTHPLASTAMELRGVKAPVVGVNRKTDFQVQLGGKSKKVSLADLKQLKSLPMETILEQIVEQELKAKRSASASQGPGRKQEDRMR